MRNFGRFPAPLVLWLLLVGISAHNACAQTPLKTINNPQGGMIVYGLVDGATTQAAAMSSILRTVHNNCGEKPQVGKVFKVRRRNQGFSNYLLDQTVIQDNNMYGNGTIRHGTVWTSTANTRWSRPIPIATKS